MKQAVAFKMIPLRMVKTEREMYLTGNELSSALKMADSKSWYGTCHRIRARNSLELI